MGENFTMAFPLIPKCHSSDTMAPCKNVTSKHHSFKYNHSYNKTNEMH